jgi:N-acetylmuramoyl-L-alanine amidase
MTSLFAGAAPVGAARSQRVDRARYSVQGSKTRVVLDTSGRCDYRVTTHKNPDRIAINIPNVRAGKLLRPMSLEKGVVRRVRVNRLSWGTQIVLDLNKTATWNDFTLKKNGELPDRIVIDVFDARQSRTFDEPARSAGKPARRGDLYIIAIDPGHGGKDRGTKGNGLVEKTLVLDISKRIANRINQIDGYKAVLTRSQDVYLKLERRVYIAASKRADAFVSIHLNWAPKRSARGFEVFFISPHGAKVTTSRLLSNPNRAASELGLGNTDNADLLHMLVDVNQQSIMARSELLAEAIFESMRKKNLPPPRTVRQKSFEVLRTIEMPSVLVEAGFVSNGYDAKIIRSPESRQRIADAISNGIVKYFSHYPPPRGRHEPVVVHKVQRGDSLWKISRRYNTSVAKLCRANNLNKSSVLHVGQELLVTNRY